MVSLVDRQTILGLPQQRKRTRAVPAHATGSTWRFGEDWRSNGLGPQRQNLFLQRHHVLEVMASLPLSLFLGFFYFYNLFQMIGGRYDEEVQSVELDYPRDMSMWKGVPNNIDSVFQYKNGRNRSIVSQLNWIWKYQIKFFKNYQKIKIL